MSGAHPDAENTHASEGAPHARDRALAEGSRPPISSPAYRDLGIRPGPDRDFEVCERPSAQVLSTHRELLDAIVACHALANAYNINVWQEVDSDGHALPEPRLLYTRRSDRP